MLLVENALGRSLRSGIVSVPFFPSTIINSPGGARVANSAMTCLQAPQGVMDLMSGEKTATATISLSPAETAFWMAARSAQTVSPEEAFSTLHPVYVPPLAARAVAPTRIPE